MTFVIFIKEKVADKEGKDHPALITNGWKVFINDIKTAFGRTKSGAKSESEPESKSDENTDK